MLTVKTLHTLLGQLIEQNKGDLYVSVQQEVDDALLTVVSALYEVTAPMFVLFSDKDLYIVDEERGQSQTIIVLNLQDDTLKEFVPSLSVTPLYESEDL